MLTYEQESTHTYHKEVTVLHAVTSLYLENFRNYQTLSLVVRPVPVFLKGDNGAGKTSILEAISLLMPGRGLKSVDNNELKRDHQHNWLISSHVKTQEEEYQIGTGLINIQGKVKRVIKVNGEHLKTASELSNYLNIIWLTPQLEQSLLESSGNRRRLFDRMVYNFYSNHASLVLQYEKKVKERQHIFKMGRVDEKWLEIIEIDLAELNYQIAHNRLHTLNLINETISKLDIPFPKLYLKIKGNVEDLIEQQQVDKEQLLELIKKNRKLDQLSGKTTFGVHRTDLEIYHYEFNRLINFCSTGEQKAMVLSLILFQAFAKKMQSGFAPIMLLDEVMVHLDGNKRHALLDTLQVLEAQSWITSTDDDFWGMVNFEAEYFEISNGKIKHPT
ncbi:DNA replication/repair protein RecF [Rickettsiales endosymbiont of Stachyamoeba lipophora]|uniref:DNA replication/repair protein RecF n=1 Tax=Rickettsiales endosymbiont of Stachyamoeba lipophora TaxID=2486578 RepID=UPI000F648113|nr:DNA replication/repair protein RecF [Rickettsiales endosymbiont of Stachyamoeba lipophora]AZL15150.1 DNA replication/repair protein RecF [Rickettsiales endosymbiont of Stachyamoeba lipophora]